MRAAAASFASLLSLSLAACGGSSFEPAASAQAGAGGAATGQGGATSAGSGGATNAGWGGATSAGWGGAPSAGSGGVTSAGAGGVTSAGSGGAPSAGSAGSPAGGKGGGATVCEEGKTKCASTSSVSTCVGGEWSQPAACPGDPSGCSLSACVNGACAATGAPPNDPPHDCMKVVCSGGTVSTVPDPKDLPAAEGACDVPSCGSSGPVHTASDEKCAVTKRCLREQGYACLCRACPDGSVAGLPGAECAFPSSASASPSGAAPAINGSASSGWLPSASAASISVDGISLPMAELRAYPTVPPATSGDVKIDWTLTVKAASGAVSTYLQSVVYTGGDPPALVMPLDKPVVVTSFTLKGSSTGSTWGISEITYLLCP